MHPRILLKKKMDFEDLELSFVGEEGSNIVIDPAHEEEVMKIWREREIMAKENDMKLWDGDNYRLENIEDFVSDSKSNDERVHLKLGIVKFRYIMTMHILEDYYNEHPESRTNHIGVTAITKTKDGFYVFGERRVIVDDTSKYDFIGGAMCKEEQIVTSGKEIREQLYEELFEEIGLQRKNVTSLQFCGIVQTAASNVLLFGEVEADLTKDQFEVEFQNRSDNEMKGIKFVSASEVVDFIKSLHAYRPMVAELLD